MLNDGFTHTVQLVAKAGYGKSTLVSNTCKYLQEREFFAGGIIHLDCAPYGGFLDLLKHLHGSVENMGLLKKAQTVGPTEADLLQFLTMLLSQAKVRTLIILDHAESFKVALEVKKLVQFIDNVAMANKFV